MLQSVKNRKINWTTILLSGKKLNKKPDKEKTCF